MLHGIFIRVDEDITALKCSHVMLHTTSIDVDGSYSVVLTVKLIVPEKGTHVLLLLVLLLHFPVNRMACSDF